MSTAPKAPPSPHFCDVCGDMAFFGVGVSLRQNRPGKWYCRAHLPDPFTRRLLSGQAFVREEPPPSPRKSQPAAPARPSAPDLFSSQGDAP